LLDSLRDAVRKFLTGSTPYEKAVDSFIKDIQKSLISADVNVKLVSSLTSKIRKRLVDEKPPIYVDKREWFLKVVYEELSSLFGGDREPQIMPSKIPYVIMLVGVQGSGKTTTAGKLALFYKRKGYKVGLIGADVYRPAALDQLKQIGSKIGVEVYGEPGIKDAILIVKKGLEALLSKGLEVIIVDTAGRHGYGEEAKLMEEMREISKALNPDEVVLVLDASIGQKASDLASRFNEATKVGSIIVTKMDGTAKGGGAISATAVTGAVIKFIGTGEGIEEIEPFNPRRYVARLLGVGDIETIVEKLKATEEFEEIQSKMEEVMEGKGKMTLREVYKQIKALRKMGPLSKVLQMMPGVNVLPRSPSDEEVKLTEEKMSKWIAIIDSMTYREIEDPSIIDRSRARRIANGAGVDPEDVKELLKYYSMTQRILKMLRKRKDLGKILGAK
jgi:signal recognition particle subunit SRP54